jgi:hypothetical protein
MARTRDDVGKSAKKKTLVCQDKENESRRRSVTIESKSANTKSINVRRTQATTFRSHFCLG